MTYTADDIKAEHLAAMATLTVEQRRALERMRCSRQHARFNGRYPEENLQAMFESEAQARTDDAGRIARAA